MTNTCTIAGTSVVCSMMKLNRDTVRQEICSVDGCGKKHRSFGLCAGHYKQNHINKKPIAPLRRLEKHGLSKTREYATWRSIKSRCYLLTEKDYRRYGGRGIRVCDRWKNSFSAFLSDMGKRPSDSHSIDRIDNDGDYCPENCRWATMKEQMQHTSICRFITWKGQTKNIAQWAEHLGINRRTLWDRINNGLPLEKAFSTKKFPPHS